MSAISNIFWPASRTPLNDFENEIIRVNTNLKNVGGFVRAINALNEPNHELFSEPLRILNEQASKINNLVQNLKGEIEFITQKKCGSFSCNSKRLYKILSSGSDTVLSLIGLALIFGQQDEKGKILGGALAGASQAVSKFNDVAAHRREEELKRKSTLDEYLFNATNMDTAIDSMRECLEFRKPEVVDEHMEEVDGFIQDEPTKTKNLIENALNRLEKSIS